MDMINNCINIGHLRWRHRIWMVWRCILLYRRIRVILFNRFSWCQVVKMFRLPTKINSNLWIYGRFVCYLVYRLRLRIKWRDPLIRSGKGYRKLYPSSYWMFSSLTSLKWYCMGFRLSTSRSGERIRLISNLIRRIIKLLNGFGNVWRLLTRIN